VRTLVTTVQITTHFTFYNFITICHVSTDVYILHRRIFNKKFESCLMFTILWTEYGWCEKWEVWYNFFSVMSQDLWSDMTYTAVITACSQCDVIFVVCCDSVVQFTESDHIVPDLNHWSYSQNIIHDADKWWICRLFAVCQFVHFIWIPCML